jgi:ABC-type glycerol-3-phosphate transport system substrate-binding protein
MRSVHGNSLTRALVVLAMALMALGAFAQQKTMQIYIPWGVERSVGSDPMANAFRAWRDQVAAKKFPGIKVEIVTAEWEDHWSWLKTRIATKETPDVVVQRVDQGHGYVNPTADQERKGQAFWAPLDDLIKQVNPYTGKTLASEYSPAALAAARGTLKSLYYLPISQGARAFIYDADAFAKAGITKAPATFAEFLADLPKLKAAGYANPIGGTGQATDEGFAMDIADSLASSALLSWFQSIAGSDPVNPDFKKLYQAFADGKISYKDPRIKAIFDAQKKAAAYVDPATYTRTFDNVYGPFTQGDFALMSEYNGRFIRVNNAINAGSSKIAKVGTFGYPVADAATVPGSDKLVTLPGQLSSWGCTMSVSAEAKARGTYDAAIDFLRWWASGAEDKFAWDRNSAVANGDVPPTKSAIQAWEFRSAGESMLQDFAPGWGAMMLAPNGSVKEKIYAFAQAYDQGQIGYDEFAASADDLLKKEGKLQLSKM